MHEDISLGLAPVVCNLVYKQFQPMYTHVKLSVYPFFGYPQFTLVARKERE